MSDEPAVRDNPDQERFELPVGNDLAVLEYLREGDRIVFVHTFVPESARGHGVAGRLIGKALTEVRAEGLAVEAQCPTVADYMKRHPDA